MISNIILVHGFLRSERDMFPLKSFLCTNKINALTVNLPTTFESIEKCTKILTKQFNQLDLLEGKIHFVGHSMGGLILLNFLSKVKLSNAGRCVLIGSPVNGSDLADFAFKLSPILTRVFKGLFSLRTKNISKIPGRDINNVEFGVIAGDKNRFISRIFLEKENDGRVSVSSTKLKGMKDFAILPYKHTKIHHEIITANLVMNFLHSGFFHANK